MSLEYRKLEYELNEIRFVTIESLNDKGERVWIKSEPIKNQTPTLVANILDRPEDVNWNDKRSHFEEIHPLFQRKRNYLPAVIAGSFSVQSGTFTLLKEPDAQIVLFPSNPLNPNYPIEKFEVTGNLSNSSTIVGSINTSAWIGYATTTGTISLI